MEGIDPYFEKSELSLPRTAQFSSQFDVTEEHKKQLTQNKQNMVKDVVNAKDKSDNKLDR